MNQDNLSWCLLQWVFEQMHMCCNWVKDWILALILLGDGVAPLLLVSSYGCFSGAVSARIPLYCDSGNGTPNEISKQCFLFFC